VTDNSTDVTLYTILTIDELAEPLEIAPEMYKYTERSVKDIQVSPELRIIKVGKSFF